MQKPEELSGTTTLALTDRAMFEHKRCKLSSEPKGKARFARNAYTPM